MVGMAVPGAVPPGQPGPRLDGLGVCWTGWGFAGTTRAAAGPSAAGPSAGACYAGRRGRPTGRDERAWPTRGKGERVAVGQARGPVGRRLWSPNTTLRTNRSLM